MTNVIRFPIERRRTETHDPECYVEITANPGVTVVTDRDEGLCPSWGHIWTMGEPRCLCGKGSRDAHGRPA